MRRVEVDLLPAQADLIEDETSPIVAFVGGLGSGKTRAAVYKALRLGSLNAPCAGLFVEPTYPLVRDIAFRSFQQVLEELSLPYTWHKTEHILRVGRGAAAFEVYLRSGDKPERIIGFNAGWAVIDEPGQQDEEVGKRVLQRIRDPRAKLRQAVLTGTPEGFNWLYDWLITRPMPGTRVIRARTMDNWHLSRDYVASLTARLTDEEREAYLNGEFVNLLAGSVYSAFKRSQHDRPCTNRWAGQPLIGADFNVGFMHFVIGRQIGEEVHIWGELVRKNTNTFEMSRAILEYLCDEWQKDHGRRISPEEMASLFIVHCDATGAHRRSSATRADTAILREHGFKVLHPAANPPVRDRVYSVNDGFRRLRVLVDSRGAPVLVRCLEQQAYDDNGEPDKTNDLDHGPDALGYLVWMRPGYRVTTLKGNARTYEHPTA